MLKNLIAGCLIFILGIGLSFANPAEDAPVPDEGMWLPIYLKKLNERDMKNDGAHFSADDVYNINHSSFKDAVVCLNGGQCTGEIVSDDGLILTNHHCGYDNIAEHSTVENNYLKNGFFAKSKSEELVNKDFTVQILVFMEDETSLINNAVKDITSDDIKRARIRSIRDSIAKDASQGDKYKAEVKGFFAGNDYYLVVYQVFTDVRLVGAPPASIGKFGGDVDNWMWPRQTGDFSMFRIYTGPDGKPAPYSTNNIPYKPKYFFPISLKGEKKDDFAMVMGFPGNTSRYVTSYDLEFNRDCNNPASIDVLETEMGIMKKDMDANEAVKLKLAANYASLANTEKYLVGQELMLKHGAGFDVKIKQEKEFQDWTSTDKDRKDKYGNILNDIKDDNAKLKSLEPQLSYFFGMFNSSLLSYGFNYYAFSKYTDDNKSKPTRAELDTLAKTINPAAEAYFKDSGIVTDKKVLKALLLDFYNNVPEGKRPAAISNIIASEKKAPNAEAAINMFIDDLEKKSVIVDARKNKDFLDHPNIRKLKKDPFYIFMGDLIKYYFTELKPVYDDASQEIGKKHKLYMQALREWQSNKTFYPDANSTLRISYGKVLPYKPRDAVSYKYYTTYEGILEKYNPKDPEFMVPQRELDLFAKKDFGRYAEDDTLRINFIANTDITGGNSGSPVLDADGNLIGLAFDGDWESMIGDLAFNPATNRTICVDIRYVLWIIDKYAGASNLINEMKIVER